MLYYPGPIMHRSRQAGVAVFVLLAGAAAAWMTGRTPPAPDPVVQPAPPAPAIAAPATQYLEQELSLQETLDRLGYTINVPRSFGGLPVAHWGSYRTSDRSDVVSADAFYTREAASFQLVSQQSYLGSRTTFGLVTGDSRIPIIGQNHMPGEWLGGESPVADVPLAGRPRAVQLYIDHPAASYFGPSAQVPLSSDRWANPGRSQQLMVLPVRTGGTWVETGAATGYWEGGTATGDYVLCWEDLPNGDRDFQDLIFLAHGIQPLLVVRDR